MARLSTRKKNPALLKVAMTVPSEKECGISTYSHFLSDELKKIPSISTRIVENYCNNDIFSYAAFAHRLESEADVIHIQYEFGRFGKIGISGVATPFFYYAFRNPKKIITTLHELPQRKNPLVHYFQKIFLGTILKKSGTIIVHTHQMYDYLRTTFPNYVEKIVIIPHGMHLPPTTKNSPRPHEFHGKKVIGFFGFLAPHKNVEAIIDALAQLPDEYAALIAGRASDENYAHHLRQYAEKNGVSSRIRWIGFVPEKKMSNVFSWMDAVIFPYTSVTESGALHLALGHRRVVLASHLPAFEEISDEYGCILLFSNANELVKKIRGFETRPAEKAALLKKLDAFIHARNWKTIASEHAALYTRRASNQSLYKSLKTGY